MHTKATLIMTMRSYTLTSIALLCALYSASTVSSQNRPGDNASVERTHPAGREDGKSMQLQSHESDSRTATTAIDHWLVLPVTTELQRLRVGTNTTVYVLVDGEYFRAKRTILDARALKLDKLRQALEPYRTSEDAAAHFYIRNIGSPSARLARSGNALGLIDDNAGDPQSEDYVTTLLWCAFLGVSQLTGFHDATVQPLTYRGTNAQTWDALSLPLIRERFEDAAPDENGLGNEKCKLFPVRTALSRIIYHGADCVLYCVPGSGAMTSTNDVQALVPHVNNLSLSTKKTLCFINAPTSLNSRAVANTLGFNVAITIWR
jgi:hypothetical protein